MKILFPKVLLVRNGYRLRSVRSVRATTCSTLSDSVPLWGIVTHSWQVGYQYPPIGRVGRDIVLLLTQFHIDRQTALCYDMGDLSDAVPSRASSTGLNCKSKEILLWLSIPIRDRLITRTRAMVFLAAPMAGRKILIQKIRIAIPMMVLTTSRVQAFHRQPAHLYLWEKPFASCPRSGSG